MVYLGSDMSVPLFTAVKTWNKRRNQYGQVENLLAYMVSEPDRNVQAVQLPLQRTPEATHHGIEIMRQMH